MQYYAKEVGLRIKDLRRKKNMTQVQLAELLSYATERQLQRIENGEIICPIGRLVELADIFNTSTDYLLFGRENNRSWIGEENLPCVKLIRLLVTVLKETED